MVSRWTSHSTYRKQEILLCEQSRTDHRRVTKIFEYPWNLVSWQHETRISLKNQPLKRLCTIPSMWEFQSQTSVRSDRGVRTLPLDPPLGEKKSRKNRFRQGLYDKISRNPISFRSPLVRKSMIVLDSGSHAVDSGSLSKELGFWIPIVSGILDSLSWIPDSKTLGSWSHKQTLFGVIPCYAFSTFLISFTENDGFLMATSPELSHQNDLEVLFFSLNVWISWLEEVDISSC